MARHRGGRSVFGDAGLAPHGKVIEGHQKEIAEYVNRIYGFGKNLGGCPGEKDCRDFKKAAGATREEKENEACTGCPHFKSKPKYSDGQTVETSFINRLLGIRQERDSGFGIDENKISYLEYQCLLMLDQAISDAERQLRVANFEIAKNNSLMLKAVLKISG